MADLPEQPAAASTTKVDVDVVVLAADRFFNERFFEYLAVDNNCISIVAHSDLRGHAKATQLNPQLPLDIPFESIINFSTSITRNFDTLGGRNLEMIEYIANKPAIP